MSGDEVDLAETIRRLYRDVEIAVREGTMLVGHDGLVVAASKMMHRLGVADDEVVGGPPLPSGWSMVDEAGDPIPPDDHPAAQAARTGASVESVVGYVPPQGGATRYLRLVAHPVADDANVAIDLVVSDSDRRREARQAIESDAGRFRTLADMLPVAVYEATPTGEITYVNPAFTKLTGLTVDETPDLPLLEIVHPDDLLSVMEAASRAPGDGEYEARYRVRHTDGSARWVTSRMTLRIDEDGQMSGFVGSIADIDDLHRAERDAQRLADIVASTSDVIAVWERGELVYLNAAAMALLERTDPDFARPGGHVFAAPLLARFADEIEPVLLRHGRWDGELEVADAAGQPVFLAMTVTAEVADDGVIGRMVVLARDILAQKRREAVLEHIAGHDALTGLANRHRLRSESDFPAAEGHAAALYVDIDHFKQINDDHGHAAGDAVLVDVARRLSDAVRSADVVARVGGDEIVVWAPATNDVEAEALAQRLVTAVNGCPIEVGGATIDVTVTVGVAVGVPESMDDLIAQADVALYRAKQTGRNRWERLGSPPLD